MKKILAAAVGAGALVALGAVAPASAAEAPAQLSVLHGVPDLTVDVYVNDELKLDDFKPGDLAGPLELPAGTYTVAITASDADDASAPAIGPSGVAVIEHRRQVLLIEQAQELQVEQDQLHGGIADALADAQGGAVHPVGAELQRPQRARPRSTTNVRNHAEFRVFSGS